MKTNLHLLLLSGLLALSCSSVKREAPVITVEGGRIQGVVTEKPGVFAYKGIPYAAPPVGDLRWKAPQPVKPWDYVLKADDYGNASYQNEPSSRSAYTMEFYWNGNPTFSEDCLYLNVWTPAPAEPGRNLPVAMWLHGGGYSQGWGFEKEMDGTEWAAKDVIMVTINYRLGIFGFMTHPLLAEENEHKVSGNYGLLDQIAALRWIKTNISQFGGDPENITVIGQSAGAASVQNLVASPLSKDLIAKAIIQSGGGLSDRPFNRWVTTEEICQSTRELMDWAGYTTLEKMRAASTEDIYRLANKYHELTGLFARTESGPVVDGYVLVKDFNSAARANEISDIPYLTGYTRDDLDDMKGNISAFCLNREQAGDVTYAYQFARPLPSDGRKPASEGAFHSSDLWYTFKTLSNSWRPFTEGDYALSEHMLTAWTNFAKYGDPKGGWLPFTEQNPHFMIFKLDETEKKDASEMGAPLDSANPRNNRF
ncbi:MAG: carboxylesterase family protein [Bacteroidales bacterium]|nr:carboxylesterase family protein [Bacteroidales bacterium]